ncbi:MAG: hypothetical protein ACOYN3_00645 [Acidimicrobiia bacterium]
MRLSFATSLFTDDAGFERQLVHVYDEIDAQIASVVVKGRDELPEYSILRGPAPVVHLGERPRLGEAAEPGRYEAWQPRGAGTGVPHYVVDATPVGIAELAHRLGGPSHWAELAEQMRAGHWTEVALIVADAMFATGNLAADVSPAIDTARAIRDQHIAEHMHCAAIAFDALFAGEITPALSALETTAPRYFHTVQLWITESESKPADVRAHWRERLATLVQEGRVDQLCREIDAMRDTPLGQPYQWGHQLSQVQLALVDGASKRMFGPDDRYKPEVAEVGFPSRWMRSETDPQRLVLVAAAYAGDPAAMDIVGRAFLGLRDHDAFIAETQADNLRWRRAHPHERRAAQAGDFAVVHATRFAPERDASGAVILRPTFAATGYGRSSLHFTLNHVVSSHLYGQWDDAGYVILAKLPDVIAANGRPENLFGVDTWWTCNPGETLRIPNAVVVRGDLDAPLFGQEVRNEIVYKSGNYTDEDLAHLQEQTGFDAAALDARLAEHMREFSVSAEKIEQMRHAEISTAVRDAVVGNVLRELGVRRIVGSYNNCSMDAEISQLARELGCTSEMHNGSTSMTVEKTSIRYAQEGFLRSYPTGGLTEANPKARRVAIAAGALAPTTPRRVVARETLAGPEFG